MRNPARLAADLAGRPLLLRESSVPALARALGIEAGERRSHLAAFFGRAREMIGRRAEVEEPVSEPEAYCPAWMGTVEAAGFGWTLKDGVGCVLIDTVLMAEGFGWGDCWYHGYDTLRLAFEEMFADARVGAIFVVLDTPGGVVDPGLPELAAYIRENRAAAGGKPVWMFCRNAFSAGYWILSSGDRAIGAREGGVGSIGAVVTHCDLSGMLEKDGIKVTPFTFGKRKVDGSPLVPLSDSAAASLQAEIDQCGRWFVADVLVGRTNLTEDVVLATEAGCYFVDSDNDALSGLKLGLIDAVMTERAAFAAIVALAAPLSPAAPAAPAVAKETDMKRSDVLAAAKKAGLKDDQVKKLSAALPEDEAPADDEDKPEDEVVEDEDMDETPAEDAPAEDDEDETEDAPEAKAIAASAEAQSHPALALTAIQTGQSLAQFRANVAAAGANGGRNQLKSTLKDSPRLRADAPSADGKVGRRRSAAADWARNSAAGRKA